jgi:signal transduction histidine kinase
MRSVRGGCEVRLEDEVRAIGHRYPRNMMRADSTTWVRPPATRAKLRSDLLLALALAFGAATTSLLYSRTGMYEEVAPTWVWVLGLALCTVPLAVRRRYPVPVAVLVAVGFFVCGQFAVPEALMVNICLFIALYTVGAWERNRTFAIASQIIIAAAMVAWLVLSLIISSSDPDWLPGVSRVGLFSAFATFAVLQIIMNLLYFAGAFFFGMNSWRAAHTRAVLEAQGRELELERQTSAAQAVALDRLAIARELHDVVAHHVSVMGVQAAAARLSLRSKPEAAEQALEIVEQSAQSAVSELHSLVHTLRSPESDEPGSTVGVAQLSLLMSESQRAGTPATLIVSGTPRALPLLVDVALYRVAQEALTNVRKHAGQGARAEVRLRFASDQVEVEIIDDGVRQRAIDHDHRAGLGLQGMRERLGAVGGSLEAGRRDAASKSPGFLVRASVPLTSYASPPGQSTPEALADAVRAPAGASRPQVDA